MDKNKKQCSIFPCTKQATQTHRTNRGVKDLCNQCFVPFSVGYEEGHDDAEKDASEKTDLDGSY